MRILAILLLSALPCLAQYRYATKYLVNTSTNTTLAANTNATYNTFFGVGAGNTVDIQIAGTVTTNAAAGTNLITGTFEKSMDGSRWTSFFSFSLRTTTNTEAFTRTNVSVAADAFIRLTTVTNGNAYAITNFQVLAGQKIGL